MADDPHEKLYKRYKKELHALYEALKTEQDEAVRRVAGDEGISEEDALERIQEEHGPLVHDPRAIRLIRYYWLEVDKINKVTLEADEGTVEPLTFLVEDLDDDDEDELVDFLQEIAYWPIGLDENNEWC